MITAEELKEIFKNVDEGKQKIVEPLIEEVVFLDRQLKELKKYPFIKIHPTNSFLQKQTAAGKMYREYLQTFTNAIHKLNSIYSDEESDDTSPLQEYFKRKLERENK